MRIKDEKMFWAPQGAAEASKPRVLPGGRTRPVVSSVSVEIEDITGLQGSSIAIYFPI